MDDSIQNKFGNTTPGSSTGKNEPVISPLDNLTVPDPTAPPPDMAPPAQAAPPHPQEEGSIDDLASQALNDLHAATTQDAPPAAPDPAQQSESKTSSDISQQTPPPTDTPDINQIQDSLSTLAQSAVGDTNQPELNPATPEPPPPANPPAPSSPHDPVPESLVVPDPPAQADSSASQNTDTTPESLVVPDQPTQTSSDSVSETANQPNQPEVSLPSAEPRIPEQTQPSITEPLESPPESLPPTATEQPPQQPIQQRDQSTPQPSQGPSSDKNASQEQLATASPSPQNANQSDPEQPTAPTSRPVQQHPPGVADQQTNPSTLPGLPADAEIQLPTKDKSTPPTQVASTSGKKGLSLPHVHVSPKHGIAIAGVLFFLVGLGVSIPAINQQLTLSNRASEPVGTQSCYQECNFTDNLCRDGLVCGVVQQCDPENPEECDRTNLCYNPQCKEASTCSCDQQGSTAAVAVPGAAGKSDDAVCSIDTRTAISVNDELIESVTANGAFWNYDEEGELWQGSTAEGTSLTSVERYAEGPCNGQETCRFDTRTTFSVGEDVIESITVGNRLWNYDQNGNLWGGTTPEGTKLTDIPQYAEGPCRGKTDCYFDTRAIKSVNGQRIETITIGSKYWDYDQNANPYAGTTPDGKDLTSVPWYAEGPCADSTACYFDSRTFFSDGEELIETITVGNTLWNFDPQGNPWGNDELEPIELSGISHYQTGPCNK